MQHEELKAKVMEDCKQAVCNIIGDDEIDYDENFFYMGIESVAMTKIVADLEEIYHVNIAYEDFIDHATLNDFSEFMTNLIERNEGNNYLQEMNYQIDYSKWGHPFELSDLQEAYYVGRLNENEYNGIPTNGYMEMVCEKYDHEKFSATMLKLINRHPMLRCFFDDDGMQHILEHIDYYDIDVTDISDLDDKEKEKKILDIRHEMVNLRVDIYEAPLLATKVTIIGKDKAIIHFYVDALILDGWSYEVFHRELEELYTDENVKLRELGVTYQDYVDFKKQFKKTNKYKEDKAFWMERIADMPEAAVLPEISPLNSIKVKIGAQVECGLDIETWHKIEDKARQHQVTPFSVLFSTFVLVVSRWNYKQRLLFNIPEFDRPMFHEDMDKILGVCSGFLLFTSDNTKKITFGEFVKQTQTELTSLIQHHGFSGIEISREMYKLTGEHDKALAPLVFGMLPDLPHKDKEILKVRYQENHTSQVWIDINTCVYDDGIQFNWNYIDKHLDKEMLENMVGLQKELLRKIAVDDSIWNEIISFELPENDRKIIDNANNTDENIEIHTLCDVIRTSLDKYSENIFVITEKDSFKYSDVKKIMLSFADDLIKRGCKAGDRIMVYMPKGIRQVCMVLAITYIGAVYVPMDYQYPIKTLLKCVENVDAKVIITSHEKSGLFDEKDIYVPDLKNVHDVEEFAPAEISIDDLLTIIHTSGSTGMPKAVMVTHKGLYNSLAFTNSKFGVNENDRCIALTNLAHDMEMYDIFGMLLAGAGILMPYQESSIDPRYWLNKMKQHKVTIWNSVPAFASMILDEIKPEDKDVFSEMRLMIFGGDYLKCETVKSIWSLNKDITIVNVGGPTETTLWNIYHVVTEDDINKGIIPYGRPIFNTKYYLLNEKLEEVPIGVVGMMYCAGIGITKGYLNDEKSTNSNYFIYEKTGERIYKTGDLGKYNENGEIIFCGREDQQIKINGKRIELNEINTALRNIDKIKDCTVLFDKDKKQLTAFIISDDISDGNIIQEQLSQVLPRYMIPSRYVKIDEIPLTKNGKVDRKKLLSLDNQTISHNRQSREVKTELEGKILDICKEFLCSDIDLDSEFFMVGGDSLLAVKLLAKLREEFDISISLTELFGKNTIGEWCDLIANKLDPENSCNNDNAIIGNKWIGHGNIKIDDEKIHLICLPHAGSSAMFFANWNRYFSDDIQVLPVQYAGRENRQSEELYDSINKMAEDFVEQCPEVLNGKFAVFGHCTGSIVGFEILKKIKEKYNASPIVFIVSSNSAPIYPIEYKTNSLSDEEFVKGISDYGFIDKSLFELDDFTSYYLPIIRNDFKMHENYVCNEYYKLNTPIYSLCGDEDPSVKNYEKVLDWKLFTNNKFTDKKLHGGHFYMNNDLKSFCELVEKIIKENI